MSYATQAAGSSRRHTLTNVATFFAVMVFTLCLGVPGSQTGAVAAPVSALKEASPGSSSASPVSSVSSIMPANRFGDLGEGSGPVSDEFYPCVAGAYGERFKGRIANLERRRRVLTYDILVSLTEEIVSQARRCTDRETGAKVNLRRLIQALEAK
jgi:hypothetical protein